MRIPRRVVEKFLSDLWEWTRWLSEMGLAVLCREPGELNRGLNCSCLQAAPLLTQKSHA